jgi:hypothetical protein
MSRNDEILRKAKYQKYLFDDELLLCDTERERLVIQRELVDLGMLSEMDKVRLDYGNLVASAISFQRFRKVFIINSNRRSY